MFRRHFDCTVPKVGGQGSTLLIQSRFPLHYSGRALACPGTEPEEQASDRRGLDTDDQGPPSVGKVERVWPRPTIVRDGLLLGCYDCLSIVRPWPGVGGGEQVSRPSNTTGEPNIVKTLSTLNRNSRPCPLHTRWAGDGTSTPLTTQKEGT